MHRPRAAFIFAVALAAACLSSPPAVKAGLGVNDPDYPPDRKVSTTPISPFGDSDQYNHTPNTKSATPPPVTLVPGPGSVDNRNSLSGRIPSGHVLGTRTTVGIIRLIAKALFGITA